jgi:hypothetical protein
MVCGPRPAYDMDASAHGQQCAVLRYEMLLNLSCTARRAPSAGSPRRRVHEGV